MSKIIAIIFSFLILTMVIELIRREKLTFKYAFGWIGVSVLAIVFSVFDQWLFALARFCGFELPSNFIFFGLLSIFVLLSLLMTLFLCQQSSRNDQMAQKIAFLEFEIKELQKKSNKKD